MTTEISDPVATTANDPEVGSAVQIRHELVTDDGAPDPAAGLHGTIAGRDPFGHFMIKIGSRKPASFARHAFIVTAAPTSQKDQNAPVWEYPQDMHVQAPGISTETEAVRLVTVPPLQAINSPTNPRRRRGLDVDSLRALADSILAHGLGNPILVRPLPASRLEETAGMDPRPAYEVIAGERRWRAAQLAELPTMPMVVRHMDDQAVLEMQLVENIEREDLDPMEEAEGFQLLREKLGYTVEQIADKMGKGRGPSYVRKRMKLLDLTPESREAMYDGTLSLSTGLLVARLSPKNQPAAVKLIKGMERKLPSGGVEPAPFRDVARALAQKFNLVLAEAAFDITDPGLVLTAGPCNTCPKRTGAEADLFGDELSGTPADQCTDSACWSEKKTAHIARATADAQARGLTIMDDAEAEQLLPNRWASGRHLPGYERLDNIAWTETGDDDQERDVTFADALRAQGRKAPKPIVVIHPHTGKVFEVLPADVAEKLIPSAASEGDEAGTKGQKPPAYTPPVLSEEHRALGDQNVRRALFFRLFESVRQRPRTVEDLRMAAIGIMCQTDDFHPHTEAFMGWSEAADADDPTGYLQEKIEALDADQLGQLITMAAMEQALDWYNGHLKSREQEQAFFEAAGLDILAVRDKVQEDLQRQQGNPDGEAIGDDQDDAGDEAGEAGDE